MPLLRTLLIFLLDLLRVPFLPFLVVRRGLARRSVRWVELDLEGTVYFFSPRQSFLRRFLRARHRAPFVTVRGVGRAIDAALELPHVHGFVVKLRRLRGGWAAIDALRDDLLRIAAAGKELVVHLPEGGTLRELYLASAGTRILLGPEGTLSLGGLSVQSRYVKQALDRLGVELEVHRRAEYKSALESVSADAMSEENRRQLTEMLEAFYGAVVEAIARARGARPEDVRAILDRPFVRPDQLVAAGLADGLAYEDELAGVLEPGERTRTTPLGRAARIGRARLFLPLRRPPTFALIRVEGTIVDGDGGRAWFPTLRDEIRRARADRQIAGVLLFVDSPGGSAQASDLLHREIVRLREKKPVVAYFANVAASGGYYIGVGAPEIVAGPLTITGSIGVIAARVAAASLFEKLGVKTEVVQTSPHADLFGPHRHATPDEHAMFEDFVEAHYAAFVCKVAEGRGRTPEEVEPLARGRVYTGAAAHALGLVDALGGLEVALDRLAARAWLSPRARRELELVHLGRGRAPVPEPPREVVEAARLLGLDLVLDLLNLAHMGGSVLYYAPGLPFEAQSKESW